MEANDRPKFRLKRPSPEIKKAPRSTQDTLSRSDNAPFIKRSHTDSPQTSSANDDPYSFPSHDDDDDDDDDVPLSTRHTSANAHAHSSARPDTKMTDRADVAIKAEPSLDLPQVPHHQDVAEFVDVVMKDTEESDRPLTSLKTVPKLPAHESTSQKKPPEVSAGGEIAAVSSTSGLPKHKSTPPPPPSNVKLRTPHKLKKLWDKHEEEEAETMSPKKVPSADEQAREGLRRSLGLVLEHVGFEAANNDALDSFLFMTETYMQSLVEDVMRVAYSARRLQPIPTDFDLSFARFNLSTSALRPHLRNPVPKSKRAPTYFDPLAPFPGQDRDLPLLGEELSGKAEKDAKQYIPAGFPDFPSIHTYRNTPVDVDTVTVRGTGLRYEDDDTPVLLPGEEEVTATPAVADSQRSDPKRIREAAAIEAKQAEEALRGLMRASKINKLKEVRAAADRTTLNKERHRLWEVAMRELVEESAGLPAGKTLHTHAHASSLREEIADQSMMVNAEKAFHRKEIPRKPQRVAQKT